jgi:hypothetical protein
MYRLIEKMAVESADTISDPWRFAGSPPGDHRECNRKRKKLLNGAGIDANQSLLICGVVKWQTSCSKV